jgi:3-hydroxybutyryl-CoA dehydrogenase
VEVRTIGIVGAGTMGTGIAQVMTQAGIRVHLVDVSDDLLARSAKRLRASLQAAVERGKLTSEQAQETEGLVSWSSGYECLGEADWAIEAVSEDMDLKGTVLRRLGEALNDRVPVATNTSTFRIAELAALFGGPERFLGMHFFNPPPAMKLVEVIPGEQTAPEVTHAAVELCERVGKTPVVVPDIAGFVVNRAFAALVAAAIDVWAQGAEPASTDQCLELGLGHKMGPLATADLVGLDVMLTILRSLHSQTGHARFEPHARFEKLVASGKLGRKSGEGFYRYDE